MSRKPFNIKTKKTASQEDPILDADALGDDSPEDGPYEGYAKESLQDQKSEGRNPSAPGGAVQKEKPFTLK